MPKNHQLKLYLEWVVEFGGPFDKATIENLARYPVSVSEFVKSDSYLGLKTVYPVIITALEDIYHPPVQGMQQPLRIGTTYREVLLTGSLGCGKSYAAVLGILYGIYLLSCLRDPHALFGLDSSSEIVILFQSIRFQTGGVAYKLAREIIEGSNFFTKSFPKDHRMKNEILLPNNIVIRPVSGELTAAIGMNIATVLLDEMSYMRYHAKSVHGEDGGEYDQARALYSTTRARIDSRFNKLGRYLIPMWLAGSARHQEDFIQSKVRELVHSSALGKADVYVYNKRIWEIKPWDYPSGESFRVFLGKGTVPPQITEPDSLQYQSENTVDVPLELKTAFKALPINAALRDICGIPSREVGSFIVEVERTKSYFNRENIFSVQSCTFLGGDLPKVNRQFFDNPVVHRPWFCHLDLSRSSDSTGIALGYLEGWENSRPQIVVAGLLEVPPIPGFVIPWDAIMLFIYRLSKIVPLYAVSTDQVGYHYLAEQLVPYGYKIAKTSDTPRSEMYHNFLNSLMEGDISIAQHPRTMDELIALNVDEKTGKVEKPAGGSKDCADALVSLVMFMKKLPAFRHNLNTWIKPSPPEQLLSPSGEYSVVKRSEDGLESRSIFL